MNDASEWGSVTDVLAVRLDAMGDVLMTTPALRALKEGGRRVALLTSPAGAAVADLVPEVDEVIVYEAPWMKASPARPGPDADFRTIERLRAAGFGGAVIFTVYSQNPLPAAFLCLLAGIPLRLAHCRENPYQLLTHWVPEQEPERLRRHEVRRQLDLVATVGCRTADERLSLRVPAGSRARARRELARAGLSAGGRWVLIHPGASAPSRRYPPELFAAAAARLSREPGCRVALIGGPGEGELVEAVRSKAAVPTHVLEAGDLADLAALIEASPVLIANNSGPAHVAAAVGTLVVDLYALTNPQHTPWGVPCRVLSHDVPCKYCYKSVCPEGHHDCLRRVPPEAVARAACELLATGRRHASAPPVELSVAGYAERTP
jgi:ADP-heptose:LPS heptosyltransferase